VDAAGANPVLVEPGAGEIVGDEPDRRVEILSDHDSLHATWSRYGPRREGADLHVHRRHTDLFYVLDGELTIRLGPEGEPVALPAGALVRVPPLVVHGFRNASDADVAYLNFHAPGRGFADFMRARHAGREFAYDQHPPPDDGGRSPSEAVIGGEAAVAEDAGLRTARLADVEEIAITETRAEPGAAPRRSEPDSRRVVSIYVLEGETSVTVGDRELRARAGSWVQVPPGIPHTLALTDQGPARFLELRT
jgi:quercetin dioxygenase-like cupin family protein